MKHDKEMRLWMLIVLVAAVLTRLGLWFVYPLTPDNDSITYLQLAKNLANKGFATYSATRPPGYPLFLALAGDYTYFAQLALGFVITFLFFYIGWRMSGRAWFGGIAALAYTFNFAQLMYEGAVLAEELSTFWLILSLAGAVYLFEQDGNGVLFLLISFLTGLAAAFAAMTRPMFILVPFLFALFYLFYKSRAWKLRLGLAFATLLPSLLIFGWYVNFIHQNYRMWGFETISGYRWLNHTGIFFQYVPDEYAALRDTYIKYRDQQIAATGTQTNAVWNAIPAMEKVTKLGYFGLSRLLSDISIQLILAHPDLYLLNVATGWWMFWWVGVLWSPEAVRIPALAPLLSGLILAGRAFSFSSNLAFILGSLVVLASKKIRQLISLDLFGWLLFVFIWVSSVAQSLADHGDNPRFLVPMQSVVTLIVLYAGWRVIDQIRQKSFTKRSALSKT